jgi:hypothetical protein
MNIINVHKLDFNFKFKTNLLKNLFLELFNCHSYIQLCMVYVFFFVCCIDNI